MRGSKWLWILTLANIAIGSLVILGIGAVLFALRAFAAYVKVLPLGILIFVGFVLSLVGIQIAKRTNLRVPRRIGLIVNGSTLAVHSIIIVSFTATLVAIPRERYLIPQGYMGNVYVIHGVGDGEPEKRMFKETTYRIPQDGILRTQSPIIHGLTTTAYYYVRADGTLERIRYEWYTTISRTPENLANDKDIGIFFPRTGKYRGNDQKCSVEFLQFYVGTKAYLLSKNQPIDLVRYLNEHPITCRSTGD
jgi:hypothetical protein